MKALNNRPLQTDPTAVQLIEEAIHLLRLAPPSTWTIYALGSCAWALGFLFFWAHTTWFAPSAPAVAWSALGLVALFVGLKTAQAEFCARLLAQRLGTPPPAWSLRRAFRLARVQTQLQSWGLILLPVALLLSVPFGWVFAFFQTATVLGFSDVPDGVFREAAVEARRWPKQNHLGLVYISVIAGAAWLNLATGFVAVPWLANRLLGIQNVFGFGGMWWLNTTFVASVSALTWLATDPLVKAFYVLRVFYGRSQRTGEDLRVELLVAHRARLARSGAILLALLSFCSLKTPLAAEAPTAAPSVSPVDPKELNRAIDEVLTRRDFQWQLRPKPKSAAEQRAEEGVVRRFVRQGFEIIKTMVQGAYRAVRRFFRWVRHFFPERESKEESSGQSRGFSMSTLRFLLYVLIGVGIVLILVVLGLIWRNHRRVPVATWTARPVTTAEPDLRDDNLEAAHLPTEGWLTLAREQMAKGEWRLAFRALYLATLARLAAEGLVTLVKSKTNLDYERELRRRAPANTSLLDRFSARRREFEAVWYGHDLPGETEVRRWFDEMQGGTPS